MLENNLAKEEMNAKWISQISFAFSMCGGYFKNELQNEVEVMFRDIYDFNLSLFFRNYEYDDINSFFSIMIKRKFDFILNYDVISALINKNIKIVDIDAAVGFAAIDLSFKFPNSEIVSIVNSFSDYKQFKKNIEINEFKHIRSVYIYESEIKPIPKKNENYIKVFIYSLSFLKEKFLLDFTKCKLKLFFDTLHYFGWFKVDILRITKIEFLNYSKDINFEKFLSCSDCIILDISSSDNEREIIFDILNPYFYIYQSDEIVLGISNK